MCTRKWLQLVWVLLVFLTACSLPNNYSDSRELLFEGGYADNRPQFSGSIKLVTWNTNYGEQLDQIIVSLTEEKTLKNADILLLQELDEVSVDVLAQALKYNYIYYPATIHPHHGKNFGNAVLSPWPLSDPQKILLPNSDPEFKQDRIAVRASVLIDDLEVAAYSVHLEHLWMLPGQEDSQLDFLLRQVGKEDGIVIVGGDFNSWSPGSIGTLDRRFEALGLRRLSKDAGSTLESIGGMPLIIDHIFANDFFESKAGIWQQTEISDHSAVWAVLSIEDGYEDE